MLNSTTNDFNQMWNIFHHQHPIWGSKNDLSTLQQLSHLNYLTYISIIGWRNIVTEYFVVFPCQPKVFVFIIKCNFNFHHHFKEFIVKKTGITFYNKLMMIKYITRYNINKLMFVNISCLKIDVALSFQNFIVFSKVFD